MISTEKEKTLTEYISDMQNTIIKKYGRLFTEEEAIKIVEEIREDIQKTKNISPHQNQEPYEDSE